MECCRKQRAGLVGDAEDVSGDVSHADAHDDCKLHCVPRLPRIHTGGLQRGEASTEGTPVRLEVGPIAAVRHVMPGASAPSGPGSKLLRGSKRDASLPALTWCRINAAGTSRAGTAAALQGSPPAGRNTARSPAQ